MAEVYPDGGYQPSRYWPAMRQGLESLNADPRFLVPVSTGEGGYVGRRVVLATEQPLTGHRSEWVRILVDLPDRAERGPIADRRTWFLAAAHSTARFALATGLAVVWDRPGTARVRPTRRAPFVQSRDFRRYQLLSARELASLTWPNGWPRRYGTAGRKRAEAEAIEHLRALAKLGYCRIRRERGGWRTMPGPDWPGWTDGQRSADRENPCCGSPQTLVFATPGTAPTTTPTRGCRGSRPAASDESARRSLRPSDP